MSTNEGFVFSSYKWEGKKSFIILSLYFILFEIVDQDIKKVPSEKISIRSSKNIIKESKQHKAINMIRSEVIENIDINKKMLLSEALLHPRLIRI